MISSAVAAALQQQSTQNGDSDSSSSSEEEIDSDTLLDEEQVLTGPEVSPALAAMVQKRIKEPTPSEVTTAKAERYKAVPKNVASTLKKTAVNVEIYSSLPTYAKTNDKRYV